METTPNNNTELNFANTEISKLIKILIIIKIIVYFFIVILLILFCAETHSIADILQHFLYHQYNRCDFH